MEINDLCQIIAEVLRVDPREVRENNRLAVELGADSLDLYQIMVKVEDRYGIQISEREFRKIRTVGDIVRLIRKNRAEANTL
ncbi:MAG: acyl carrier protein [Bilifractor sp.]|jgi:acyl carrier protein